MLRLNSRSRNKNMKNKHSKNLEKNTQEKLKYNEDYNEIILNDLVPEDKRKEFGLDNEDTKSKKQGGLKLNLGLGGKKRPNSNKKNNNNQNQYDLETEESDNDNNQKQIQQQEEIVETSKSKKSSRPKKRPNHKKISSDNQKDLDNKNAKGKKTQNQSGHNNHGHNKFNHNEENQLQGDNGKHTSHKNGINKGINKSNNKLKKSQKSDEEFINNLQDQVKKPNQNIINTKKRKRPHHKEELTDDSRNIEEVEVEEVEIQSDEEDNQDIITFRGDKNIEERNEEQVSQQKASEIKEVQGKFENIVWSEDKFPKK